MIVYGASPIAKEVLADAVRDVRLRVLQAYGLTETTGAVVSLAPRTTTPTARNATACALRHARSRASSCGSSTRRPVRDADVGEVGEIWMRSAAEHEGLLEHARGDRQDDPSTDGWFRTGDAGYLDADGYLYIHDRVKDMIVSGGENMYPAEVENVLMAHPASPTWP